MEERGLTPENVEGPVQVFNSCMDSLPDAMRKPRIDPLQSQAACWENCSNSDRSAVIKKAEGACQLVCDVMAPNDGKELFQAIVEHHQNKRETGGAGIQALVIAYQKAPSKSLKTQILSIYANRFTTKELKDIHKPFENLSDNK